MQCMTHLLTCPVCRQHVTRVGNALKCANAHTFDIAKEGYVNLQLKKLSGDTKEMLIARRNFLERGYYAPLSGSINEMIYNSLRAEEQVGDSLPHINVLDAGCGEGYYLGRLQQYLANRLPHVEYCYTGLDISKDAIRMAAKHYKSLLFVVANLKERLVFASDSFHVLLTIFAPRNIEEFARVIMPGGIALVVIPGPSHLLQLREELHLLNIEANKQQRVSEQFSRYFEQIASHTLEYQVRLCKEEVALAVTMTPNHWHISDEVRQAMEQLDNFETMAEFTCLMFRKKVSI